jgi:hypothetical protein
MNNRPSGGRSSETWSQPIDIKDNEWLSEEFWIGTLRNEKKRDLLKSCNIVTTVKFRSPVICKTKRRREDNIQTNQRVIPMLWRRDVYGTSPGLCFTAGLCISGVEASYLNTWLVTIWLCSHCITISLMKTVRNVKLRLVRDVTLFQKSSRVIRMPTITFNSFF